MTIAISPPCSSTSPKHSSPLAGGKPVPIPHAPKPRRPSSTSTSTPSPRSILAGSYPLSLLHSRLGPASPLCDFTLRIRAISPSPLCASPPPLLVPFKAASYDHHDGPPSAPWVADIDLEHHYFTSMPRDSAYPGYRVPAHGQLQLVISGPQGPVHAFIVPYDLGSVPLHGRMLARERTYSDTRLRYAVELQFVCCEGDDAGSSSAVTERAKEEGKEHYLARQVKLVFAAARGDDPLRAEREDEVVPPSPMPNSGSPGSTPTSTPTPTPNRHRRKSSVEASAEWARLRARAGANSGGGVGSGDRKQGAPPAAETRGFVPKPKGERPRSPAPPVTGASLLSALAPGARTAIGKPRAGEGKNGEKEKETGRKPGLRRTDTDTELSLKLGGLDIADADVSVL